MFLTTLTRTTLTRTTLLLVALAPALCADARPAPPPYRMPLLAPPSPARATLLLSYARYSETVQGKGALGLTSLTLPDFELRSGGHRWRGRNALLKLDRYDHGVSRFGLTLLSLRVGRERATAVVEEHLTFHPWPHSADAMFGSSVTATTIWQEDWKEVAGDWKLAALSHVASDAARGSLATAHDRLVADGGRGTHQTLKGVPFPYPELEPIRMNGTVNTPTGGKQTESTQVVVTADAAVFWRYRASLHDKRILAQHTLDSFIHYIITVDDTGKGDPAARR